MDNIFKRVLTSLIGLVIIAATLIIFFVGFKITEKQTIDYLALTFVLVSEIVLFCTLFILDSFKNIANKVFLYSGIMSTLILYLIITIILSILLPSRLNSNTNAFITVNCIAISLTIIVILSILTVSSKIVEANKKNSSDAALNECENIVFSLKNNRRYKEIENQINDLYEVLKYSDKRSFKAEKESEIRTKIIDLSSKIKSTDNITNETITDSIDEIILMIRDRNNLLKQTKQEEY